MWRGERGEGLECVRSVAPLVLRGFGTEGVQRYERALIRSGERSRALLSHGRAFQWRFRSFLL